jgi:hypothetical protein
MHDGGYEAAARCTCPVRSTKTTDAPSAFNGFEQSPREVWAVCQPQTCTGADRWRANTATEFIAYAEANPSEVNIASSGFGSTPSSAGRAVREDVRRQHGARAISR